MTIPGGLLDQSSIARLLASMQGGTQNTVQAPQTGGLMAPQIQPTPGFNPNVPPNVDARGSHDHRSGLRGGILHAVGADQTPPELAALLNPDQQERVKPGLLSTVANFAIRGRTPQQVQMERAATMLGLQDQKKLRDKRASDEKLIRDIEATAAAMGPELGAAYAARMKGLYNLEGATAATQAAVGLKEREFAPQRETWTTVPMLVNGQQMMVMRSNLGQLIDPTSGADLREQGARMEPVPLSDTFSPMAGETPAGNIPVLGSRTGQVRDSGIAKPDVSDRTQAAVRREVSSNRAQVTVIDEALAELERYPDAVGLTRAAGDAVNQRVDPQGVPARAALANIGSLRIHDRSGAAVSAKEFPRLRPFIPSVTDTYATAKKKLEALRRELERETEELERGMSRAPASTPPSQTLRKTTMPRPANATDAEWAAFLLTRGEKP